MRQKYHKSGVARNCYRHLQYLFQNWKCCTSHSYMKCKIYQSTSFHSLETFPSQYLHSTTGSLKAQQVQIIRKSNCSVIQKASHHMLCLFSEGTTSTNFPLILLFSQAENSPSHVLSAATSKSRIITCMLAKEVKRPPNTGPFTLICSSEFGG